WGRLTVTQWVPPANLISRRSTEATGGKEPRREGPFGCPIDAARPRCDDRRRSCEWDRSLEISPARKRREREPTSEMATSKTHPADRHGLIRVQGARVNNLKNVSVEIPKRRLTVFTGVSGSGKSSLVFGTIAAESQRLVNETYSAFLQGLMPSLGRPEVDALEGITTAIIVDQERMGANARSTVGTATDANAMLRLLWSRLGRPRIGSSNAFSFNVPSVRGVGQISIEKGGGKTEKRTFT